MKPRLKPINKQVVVLLGATSGIGLETAMHMAGKGAQVVIVGRNQEGLNDALEKVRNHVAETSLLMESRGHNGHTHTEYGSGQMSGSEMGGTTTSTSTTAMENQVTALEADVTNFDQVKSVADQVVQRFGRIDSWINVAAVSEWALFEDTTPDEFRRIIEVNLLGQTFGAMAALPYLKQQQGGGALIFVASIAGRLPIPYQTAYNASKHGVLGLVDTLRQELQHTGVPVSVTAILPASINTPLFEKSRTKLGVEPAPMPPLYDVKMVSRAITYAAEHPVRELIVGDAGYVMTFMRRLAPTLTGNVIGSMGFREQRSDEPKSAQAPDNLYEHITGYNETDTQYDRVARPFGVLTWLSTHPKARMAIYGSLLAGAGLLVGWRIVTIRNERRSWRYRLPRQIAKFSRKASQQAIKTADKTSKQMVKNTGKSLRSVNSTMGSLPVISRMPIFRKRSFFERAADMATGFWMAVTSISLPFLPRRKSRVGRIADSISNRMPDISVPWNRQSSMIERMKMTEQRKAAMDRFNKMSDAVMGQVDDSRKQAAKVIDKTMSRASDTSQKASKKAVKMAGKAADKAQDTSKKAQKAADKAAGRMDDRRKDVRDTLKAAGQRMPSKREMKAMADKGEVVVRRQSLIEKLPFGERRETIVEKVPINK